MRRFFGVVGYNGGSVEVKPGVWVEEIVERQYYGDIQTNTRQLQQGESVLNNLTVGNSISIVSDAYAMDHFHAIRFVEWAGALWDVTTVTVQRPRLILLLGGVYNGPRANDDPTP